MIQVKYYSKELQMNSENKWMRNASTFIIISVRQLTTGLQLHIQPWLIPFILEKKKKIQFLAHQTWRTYLWGKPWFFTQKLGRKFGKPSFALLRQVWRKNPYAVESKRAVNKFNLAKSSCCSRRAEEPSTGLTHKTIVFSSDVILTQYFYSRTDWV